MNLFTGVNFVLSLMVLLGDLLTTITPPLLRYNNASRNITYPIPLSSRRNTSILPVTNSIVVCILLTLIYVTIHCATAARTAYLNARTTRQIGLTLQSGLCHGVITLNPSCGAHVGASSIIRSTNRNIRRVRDFFRLFLPRLFCTVLTPVALFITVTPVGIPTTTIVLIYTPLVVVIANVISVATTHTFGGC